MRLFRIIAFSFVLAALTACGSGDPKPADGDAPGDTGDSVTARTVTDTLPQSAALPASPHPSLSNLMEEADKEFDTAP